MTKKIFGSILLVASAVLAASFAIILGVLYEYYTAVSEAQLKAQTAVIAKAVDDAGGAYFEGLDTDGYRVTWIAGDGTVLYDSEADAATLQNHADREEFIEAQDSGAGSSARYSATLTERMLYYAKRLGDGSVVRVACAQNTVLTLVLGMLQPLLIVLVLAVMLSAILASRLSKRIVEPLNALDLDAPLSNDTYDELSPLLTRIERQHRQIDSQLRELKRKREEWNAVTGSMNEGIVLLSPGGEILSINKSAAKILGTTPRCVGADMLTICRRPDVQRLLERAAGAERAELVTQFGGADYQLNASPVHFDGSVRGVALLFFDVTDRVRAEQLRREFTANVSHELKTPLHIISGTAELIKDGLVEPEDMPGFIERIYSESLRMVKLVEDIIALSRLDEGVNDVHHEDIRLKELALSTAAELEPAAEKENIAVSVTGDDAVIYGIPALIAELIYNLLDNAIKYNRICGSVQITVEDKPDEVILTVSDTGAGIPPEAQERVFERFYRVDKSRSRAIGGTGLGLSIVKHAARLHGAKTRLTSAVGVGTQISVAFPKQKM